MRPILLPLLLIAGCGQDGGDAGGRGTSPSGAPDDRIACATEGATEFEAVCTVEREAGPAGTILTLRSPSGGFRRLRVTTDGRGVVAADGAERATVTVLGADRIEVALGGDRYRLPAHLRR
ncbi:MAG: hypothetical protein QOH04_1674 [Sphingomonadales bacterium]|jgi:hypothetical protein|nr:hypothetical protein [Sphingomonadales bacterium]MEA3035909.1 hypothetical protein [Sphingomonadales bacterium]